MIREIRLVISGEDRSLMQAEICVVVKKMGQVVKKQVSSERGEVNVTVVGARHSPGPAGQLGRGNNRLEMTGTYYATVESSFWGGSSCGEGERWARLPAALMYLSFPRIFRLVLVAGKCFLQTPFCLTTFAEKKPDPGDKAIDC